MLLAIGLIIAGFFLLMWSADLLVDNATELASQLGISTFLIGIVVVGFGTSAPEMFVSAVSALQNKGNLALGNALGSNITNIGLVLGSAALLRALPVTKTTARIDIPIVILAGAVAIYVVSDGLLSNGDGLFLLALLVTYLVWSAMHSEGAGGEPQIEQLATDPHELDLSSLSHPRAKSTPAAIAWTIGSIVLLMLASQMLVKGAVTIATMLGVGELVIDLTKRSVAVGEESVSLTPTEFGLLAAMASHPGRPFSREQLMDLAYDVAYSGYDRAIDSHIKNLRQKIEPDPRQPLYVLTVYGLGYKLSDA